jgi:hypothetical protein
MSDTAAGLLTVLTLVVILGVTHVPLGDYMARVYSATKHWRAEQVIYRAYRIDPDADQTWATGVVMPTNEYLPVRRGTRVVGHFLVTAASHVAYPSHEQRRVAVLLADQVAAAVDTS